MCSYCIFTLKGPFFNNMLWTHVKEFVDLVKIRERIEAKVQEGKVEMEVVELRESKKGQFQKYEGMQSYHPINTNLPLTQIHTILSVPMLLLSYTITSPILPSQHVLIEYNFLYLKL